MKDFQKVCIALAVVLHLANAAVYQERCGVRSSRQGRIVGGSVAKPGQYPWIVSIRAKIPKITKPVHLCGGAIIGKRWILTAAHCFARHRGSSFTVRVGSFFRSNDYDPLKQDIKVTRIITHPSYVYPVYFDDIALLELDRPIDYKWKNAVPICLPRRYREYVGVNAVVAGWGWLDEDRNKFKQPNTLRHVVLPVRDHNTCQMYYSQKGVQLRNTQMCAGYNGGGKDACQGDSGGPLIWEEGGQHFVIGIVSAGIGCARPRLPGLYTKVSYYRDWILRTIN